MYRNIVSDIAFYKIIVDKNCSYNLCINFLHLLTKNILKDLFYLTLDYVYYIL
jgi:hypothetical protein